MCMPAHCALNIVCKSTTTNVATRSREYNYCIILYNLCTVGTTTNLPHSINLLCVSVCEKITILMCSFLCTKFIIILISTGVHIREFSQETECVTYEGKNILY